MKCRAITVWSACGLLAAILGAAGCSHGNGKKDSTGPGKETVRVTLTYVTKPSTELPKGLNTLAVLDSETTDDTEKKWSGIAANMISGLLDEAARRGGAKLTVADRQNVSKIMKEKDMAMAGIVEGAKAAEAAKLLNVQGMIASTITVKVEKHAGKGRTISAANVIAWSRGGGGGVETEEIEKVSRNITVQCRFALIDAATGKVLIDHVSPTLRKTDKTKTSPFFGASKTEAELTPRDEIIGELVEKEVRKFIGRFMPCQVEETIEVRPSKNEACKAGVRLLAAGEYDQAIKMFEDAIAASEEGKDKYAVFGLGVAYEAKGDLEKALKTYRDAVVLDSPGAEQAMQRVKARMAAAGGEAK